MSTTDTSPAPLRKAPAPPKPDAKAGAPRQAMRQDTARITRDGGLRQAPQGLTRQRLGHIDQFEIPEQVRARFKEAGWALEWKRATVMGQNDISYDNALAENHWEPVTTDELTGYMPKGHAGAIIRDGMSLMKRPAYLSAAARKDEINAARAQLAQKEAQLRETPEGTLTRDVDGVRPTLKKNYEPIEVPEDDDKAE